MWIRYSYYYQLLQLKHTSILACDTYNRFYARQYSSMGHLLPIIYGSTFDTRNSVSYSNQTLILLLGLFGGSTWENILHFEVFFFKINTHLWETHHILTQNLKSVFGWSILMKESNILREFKMTWSKSFVCIKNMKNC